MTIVEDAVDVTEVDVEVVTDVCTDSGSCCDFDVVLLLKASLRDFKISVIST